MKINPVHYMTVFVALFFTGFAIENKALIIVSSVLLIIGLMMWGVVVFSWILMRRSVSNPDKYKVVIDESNNKVVFKRK